jgi:hypothetical protein
MEKKKLGRNEQKKLIGEGKYQCSCCMEIKPITEFGKDRSSVKGFSSKCKDCKKNEVLLRTKKRIENRPTIKEKECRDCNETKCVSEFNGDKRTIDGYAAMCKSCWDKYWSNWYHNERSEESINKQKLRSKRNYIIYNESGVFPSGKTIKQSRKERSERYKPKRNKRKNERYRTEPDFKFKTLIMQHLKGVKNREDFNNLWDDVREVYDFFGITYHIDHLIPKNWFINKTPMELINHIDNLQVIDADYNISKQDRWSDPVPSDYLDKIRPYIKKEYLGLLKSL